VMHSRSLDAHCALGQKATLQADGLVNSISMLSGLRFTFDFSFGFVSRAQLE